MEEQKILFSNRFLVRLVVPMVVEQLLSVAVGMIDMMMASGAGEAAVSGISLVNTIANLLVIAFSAMASGGAVVTAQFLGKKDKETATVSGYMLVLLCIAISAVITGLSVLYNRGLLRLIYGSVEQDVMDAAVTYFYITALSFPFLAVYNACAGLFRVMGNSRVAMMVSAIMNGMNIIGNAVFIFGFGMAVDGVAYATLISRATAAVILLILLRNPDLPVSLPPLRSLRWNRRTAGMILQMGVPQAAESSLFQVGKLLTQSLISSFGTAAIAANACGSTVEGLATIPASAMGLALITVGGQCVGAGRYDQARYYAKKLIRYAYYFMWGLNVVIFAAAPWIASLYHLEAQSTVYAVQIIRYHSVCCCITWPLALTLPNVLRAAGDVKFTMMINVISMWIFRIGLAYLIGGYLGEGVLGVWIAMTLDWAVRAFFYIIRFHGHRWEGKAVAK